MIPDPKRPDIFIYVPSTFLQHERHCCFRAPCNFPLEKAPSETGSLCPVQRLLKNKRKQQQKNQAKYQARGQGSKVTCKLFLNWTSLAAGVFGNDLL